MKGYSTFLQSSRIGASPSNGLVSYTGHSFGGGGRSYPSAGIQSAYSTFPADWAVQGWSESCSKLYLLNTKSSSVLRDTANCPPLDWRHSFLRHVSVGHVII